MAPVRALPHVLDAPIGKRDRELGHGFGHDLVQAHLRQRDGQPAAQAGLREVQQVGHLPLGALGRIRRALYHRALLRRQVAALQDERAHEDGGKRVAQVDLVGSGQSDLSAYRPDKYATLQGYADDILEVLAEVTDEPAISSAMAFLDGEGKLSHFLGVLQDITDASQRRAEAEDRALFAEQMVGIASHGGPLHPHVVSKEDRHLGCDFPSHRGFPCHGATGVGASQRVS